MEAETRVKLNLTPEQIKEKYGDNLESEVYGPLSDVLSNLLKHVAGVQKIIVTNEFKSAKDENSKAIKCSVKA